MQPSVGGGGAPRPRRECATIDTQADRLSERIARVLVRREQIEQRLDALARQIAGDFGDHEITLAAVMTGSIIFLADLIRRLPVMMRVHLVQISSYPGSATESQGPQLLGSLPEDLGGRHVLLVDDILDSGRTLRWAVERLTEAGAASVRTCVLLRKPAGRRDPAGLDDADYVGFEIADEFVVGYGLDYNDYYRNLPYIAVLKELSDPP